MQISLENIDQHTIRSYTDTQISVNDTDYSASVLISRQSIIPNWSVRSVQALSIENLEPLLRTPPEIIIIGHNHPGIQIPRDVVAYLSSQRIGIECMTIGAACRTFNVLLSEQRVVILGVVF